MNISTKATLFCAIAGVLTGWSSLVQAGSLNGLLHEIEQSAPTLQVAAARSQAARAAIEVAKSQLYGHAEVFGRDSHFDHDRLVNPIHYPPTLTQSLFDSNTFGYGAAVTLPIDIDGRIRTGIRAQQQVSQAATENRRQVRLQLFGQAITLYRGLQRLQGKQQALRQQHEALLNHQKMTSTAVQVGRVAAVELLRIETEIKAVEGQLAGLRGDEARIRAGLGALLNRTRYSEAVGLPSIDLADTVRDHTGSNKLQQRPDVLAAKSLVHADNERLQSARQAWFPSLSVRAEMAHNQGYTAQGQNTWSVTGQLSWQFWDGGRRHAKISQALAKQEAARLQYRDTLNQATSEWQSAIAAWQASRLQYQAAVSGLKLALEAEHIQSNRFTNGRISSVDLIDAETSLARARADRSSALVNWWQADDRLRLAQGLEPRAYQKKP